MNNKKEFVAEIDQIRFRRLKFISWIIFVFAVLFSGLSILTLYHEVELWNGFLFYLLYTLLFPCLMATVVFRPLSHGNYSTARMKLISTSVLCVLPAIVMLYVFWSIGNFPE